MKTDKLQPKTLDDIRLERAKLSLRFGIYALIVNGGFWLLFDVIMQQRPHVLLNVILVIVCVSLFLLYKYASYRVTAFTSYAIIYLFVFLVSSFDVPDANIQRSQHLFFIAAAMYPYILFYKEKVWIPLSLALLCVATYIFFEFSHFTIPEASVLAPHIRWYVAIGINVSACLAIAAVIHIIHADLQTKDKSAQALSQAIFENQLELYYQPQVNQHGHLIGAEALIRWNHPTLGILSPSKFIPYAEKTGGIIAIGHWILDVACKQLLAWQQHDDTKDLILSINIAAPEMHQADFVYQFERAIQRYHIDPSKLKLEITETTLLDDMDDAIRKMQAISALGITFTLDDFGTGYSSLNILKTLPLKEIKIDKSFVDDIQEQTTDLPITDTLLNLSESLDIKTLAEGIESEAQWQYLKNKGCHSFQGYYFGKPMSISKFNQYVKKSTVVKAVKIVK